MEIRLYLLQRITAMIMAPLVLLHLAVMIYAVQGGLSSEEILGRTQGSLLWGMIYGLFVICASIHAGIGIRVVMREWLQLNCRSLNSLSSLMTLFFLGLGFRAVYAVVIA